MYNQCTVPEITTILQEGYKEYFLSRPIYLYPSIWFITTTRYYFWGTTFIITNQKCYGKKSDQMSTWPQASPVGGMSDQMSTWPTVVSHLATRCLCLMGYIWPKVSLTLSLTKCQPDLKPHPGGCWPKVNLTWSLTKFQPDPKPHPRGDTSDQMSTWSEVISQLATRCLCLGVCLTKGQPEQKSDQMSNWPKASSWGVHLTKGQPDPKIWKNVNLTWNLICSGSPSD